MTPPDGQELAWWSASLRDGTDSAHRSRRCCTSPRVDQQRGGVSGRGVGRLVDHLDLPGDDRGSICVVDRAGEVTVLAEQGEGARPRVVAEGDEVWFTATTPSELRALVA